MKKPLTTTKQRSKWVLGLSALALAAIPTAAWAAGKLGLTGCGCICPFC